MTDLGEDAFDDTLMTPIQAVTSNPPNAWLTSFYGFAMEEWGFLSFPNDVMRTSFLRRSKPGVIIVVYGALKSVKEEYRRILGLVQCSHEIGHAREFMSPAAWRRKEDDSKSRGRWNYAVEAVRAWRVAEESRWDVDTFAPHTTRTRAYQIIGAQGMPLTKKDAANILKLNLEEVSVYGRTPIVTAAEGRARQVLTPSRAANVTRESEGPKHLYIMRLDGDADVFLGEPARGRIIIKAGFSKNPIDRCRALNWAYPPGPFRWTVLHSGEKSGFKKHSSSRHAKVGERAMQRILQTAPGESLGGEFFLATRDQIDHAWQQGEHEARTSKI